MAQTLAVFIATSLDGYIAGPAGELDWLATVEQPGESYGYDEFFASVDALVVGRATYDTAARFPTWPWAGKRVIVATHRPLPPDHGVEAFAGDVAGLPARLAASRRVYVDGGQLIGQCLAAGLIDELTISVVPIVLGGGRRLFAGGEGRHRLALIAHRAWPSGLAQARYRVER